MFDVSGPHGGSDKGNPPFFIRAKGKGPQGNGGVPATDLLAWFGALAALIVGLIGLFAYLPGFHEQVYSSGDSVPMAPSTSVSFLGLGGCLVAILAGRRSPRSLVGITVVAGLITLFAVLEVIGHLAGLDLNLENVIVPEVGRIGNIPVARMSVATAVGFVLAGFGTFTALKGRHSPGRLADITGWTGLLVVVGALVFMAAYVFGAPLMYGQGETVPMALSTALAFLLLGVAVLGVPGPRSHPIGFLPGIYLRASVSSPKIRLFCLLGIMVASAGICVTIMASMLYRSYLRVYEDQLQTTAVSQARLIEAVARHAGKVQNGTGKEGASERVRKATLDQIVDAHKRYSGFGKTGEFTLAYKADNRINFIIRQRKDVSQYKMQVELDSILAEPMRKALGGEKGILIGIDYRGVRVLAAYEPVAAFGLGIVAKIDIAEIKAPVVWSVVAASVAAIVVILIGVGIFLKIGTPIISELEAYSKDLEKEIHRRQETEGELRESQGRYHSLVEMAPMAVCEIDLEGVCIYANAAWNLATGETGDVQTDRGLADHIHEKDREAFLALWEETAGDVGHQMTEFRVLGPEGRITWMMGRVAAVEDASGRVVQRIGSFVDITQRKQAEAEKADLEIQARQSQKMEAVGQLAGGIAHDFNNYIQVINGFGELAISHVPDDHEARRCMGKVLNASKKAANLTSQLLAFSRRQVLEVTDVDLNRTIGGVTDMLAQLTGDHIELKMIPGGHLGSIKGDPGQIEQILMNLCVNAIDAMPDGGRITIETENVCIDEEYCRHNQWARPGQYVLLSVSDTGCGMPPEVVENIFEPFYTTKKTGKGTGLGLSTVYGLMQQHHGFVKVYTEPGTGTAFKLFFPIVTRSAATVGSKIRKKVVGGNETILVAEDDPDVLELARSLLEEYGYTVIEAVDGQDAVEKYEAHRGRIDLVLLDVIMPKLNGKKVYEIIRQRDAELPVIFSSGYSANAIHTNFILDEGLQLISKPYEKDDLLQYVRATLGEPAPVDPRVEEGNGSVQGGGRGSVLIVDDDLDIGEFLCEALLASGYQAMSTDDGHQALLMVQGGDFQVLVTDIFMPKMEGLEIINRIRKVAPDLKVIAISGGGSTGQGGYLEHARLLGAVATLTKPISAQALLAAIAKATGPVA